MSEHIVSASSAAVEQPFAQQPDPLAAARAEQRIRAAERKGLQEIHGRYDQAFAELAVLEEQLGRDHPEAKAARSRAWAVGDELTDAHSRVDSRIAADRRRRTGRRRMA